MRIEDALEDITQQIKASCRPGTIKRKAAKYLGKQIGQPLSKQEIRQVEAKAKKIKKSAKKADRFISNHLVDYVESMEC